MGLIFYLSDQPQLLPTVSPYIWDKGAHMAEYGVLAIFWCRALRGEGLGWTLVLVLALLATSAYGLSDEWHQSFVPMRSSDPRDWLADTIGGSLGLLVYVVSRRRS